MESIRSAVLIGAGAVLAPYFLENVNTAGGLELALSLFLRLTRKPLPQEQLLLLAAVGAVLWLPLCTLRKLRNAALAARLMKGHSSSGKQHTHHEHREQNAAG